MERYGERSDGSVVSSEQNRITDPLPVCTLLDLEEILEIPVQVNGKLREVIKVPANLSSSDLEAAAKASDKVKSFLDGKVIKKVIVLPKKLVNIVVD